MATIDTEGRAIRLRLADFNDWCEGRPEALPNWTLRPARAATNDANTKKLYLEIVSAGYEWAELEV